MLPLFEVKLWNQKETQKKAETICGKMIYIYVSGCKYSCGLDFMFSVCFSNTLQNSCMPKYWFRLQNWLPQAGYDLILLSRTISSQKNFDYIFSSFWILCGAPLSNDSRLPLWTTRIISTSKQSPHKFALLGRLLWLLYDWNLTKNTSK